MTNPTSTMLRMLADGTALDALRAVPKTAKPL